MEPELKRLIREAIRLSVGSLLKSDLTIQVSVNAIYDLFLKELEMRNQPEDAFFEALRKTALNYVNYVHSPGYHPDSVDDYEAQVFEAAIVAYHGPDVWEGIRQCQQDFDLRMQARRIQRMELELAAEKERFRKATKDA